MGESEKKRPQLHGNASLRKRHLIMAEEAVGVNAKMGKEAVTMLLRPAVVNGSSG
jgi:hypothetical protein